MGNTPSKEQSGQGRSSHKLSKPRVASFQTPAPPAATDSKRPSEAVQEFLSIPYSATSSNSHAGNDDNDEDQQGSDKSTPLVAPKAQRRMSLFRSKSSQEPPDSRKSRRNTIIGSPILSSEGDAPQVARANSVSTHHITDHLLNAQPLSEKFVSHQHPPQRPFVQYLTKLFLAGCLRDLVLRGLMICHLTKPSEF